MFEYFESFARWWDALYNGVIIGNGVASYALLSVQRLLIAHAAWLMLRATGRYIKVAIPTPHTIDNVAYWARWWLHLRMRDFPMLKIGAFLSALFLLLQIPAGVDGGMARATPYLILIYIAFWLMLIGIAQLMHHLSHRIEHPLESAE